MKARILPLETDEHRQAELLLPWLANGTLEPAERSRVEAHISQCARCQSVLAFQARLRSVPDADAQAPSVDRGWAALRDRLEPDRSAAPRSQAPARPGRVPWWPLAAGLQFAVVLGLAIALVASSRAPEPYQALGTAASPPAANALVVFRPEATEAQIRAALRSIEAHVVGGPTVTDAYLLQVPALGPRAIARLRAEPAVLQVESLVGSITP